MVERKFKDFAILNDKLLLQHRAGCPPLGATLQASHHEYSAGLAVGTLRPFSIISSEWFT